MSKMSTAPLLMRLVASSVRAADKAAELVRKIMKGGDLGIIDKGGLNNFQTEADRSCERLIRATLSSQYPEVTIIGEEDEKSDSSADAKCGMDEEVLSKECPDYLQNIKQNEVVVWVDPLDGTAEFTQNLLDHVTVLIGIAVNGKAVAGVINQPFYNYKAGPDAKLGRTIWGVIGLGAFGFKRNDLPKDSMIITTTRSHSNKQVNDCIENMTPTEVVRVGGAGNKVLKLIEGKAHAYVFASPGCKKWDTCAPEAILHALGGKLTDVHGNTLHYQADVKVQNTAGVIAACSDHDWYIKKVPQSVKDVLKA
ncbi:3'(2'),5'-bisphosphate nucleotidase 1-like isoform X2 [Styela clava]